MHLTAQHLQNKLPVAGGVQESLLHVLPSDAHGARHGQNLALLRLDVHIRAVDARLAAACASTRTRLTRHNGSASDTQQPWS